MIFDRNKRNKLFDTRIETDAIGFNDRYPYAILLTGGNYYQSDNKEEIISRAAELRVKGDSLDLFCVWSEKGWEYGGVSILERKEESNGSSSN